MSSPIGTKLRAFGQVPSSDVDDLEVLFDQFRSFRPASRLVSEGDRPDFVLAIGEGWAARCKFMRDGGRQITDILLPGDILTLSAGTKSPLDFGIYSLSEMKCAFVPYEAYRAFLHGRPEIENAVQRSALADEGLMRAAVIRLGRQDAFQRVGHFFCETWCRAANVDLIVAGSLPLPLTQSDVGDIVGLTAVHVNRTLRVLREQGLLEWQGRELRIPDLQRLAGQVGYRASMPCEPMEKVAA
ncbi:Crp/Fnr family transcriptional regulator [Sphingomonas panacisoli]|uniref:Crp/Fnr family transcriptional regulator n=1 Tax=Sphingomonas panacisoli TaxID=1813879 RepID=A0A5B8LIF7_9SPHN|nr:Crp/Fnr family transcriptional regulator [Sphingomonas panacisoli]QDZ08097.1 Crp/Fnr family transcriptional regulator [Sphingomonas panacisoli]